MAWKMSARVQSLKCILYVILYLIFCITLIIFKKHFHLPNKIVLTKYNVSSLKHIVPTISPSIMLSKRRQQEQEKTYANIKTKISEHSIFNAETIVLGQSAEIVQKISNICYTYNLTTPIFKKHFLYDSEHKSIYCWIRKVASTSFTSLLFNRQQHQNRADYSIEEVVSFLNHKDYFKLLIIRHPFERLVSSYRDRLEDNSKYTAQAWIYVQKIYNLTRPELFHSNMTTGNALEKIFTSKRRLKLVPTFKEFIEWILLQRPEDDDVHWDQYYTHCSVCNINYNVILNLDYYVHEQINYILFKFGARKNEYLPHLEKSRGGITNFHVTCKYFQNLSLDTISQLYQRYKIDFEMYNYSFENYARCAMGNT